MSMYARLALTLADDEINLIVSISYYEKEQSYLDNRNAIVIDQIPMEINKIISQVTGSQYANIDMTTVHNQYKDILLNGSNATNYPPGANPTWLGLIDIDPLNIITVVMPI